MKSFRRFFCDWLAYHGEVEHVCDYRGHEIVRCPHCGMFAAIENRRRTCIILGRVEA